ncbi:hypothetical protein KRR38_33050 [Novosphingobium sp. G106]|uniref:DUF6927 domain-containing protein n=1 Tax=Novosphingobium sp. G106 TaxID=2849500 RepID=UPI001C2D2721|nr:hypothetical protein [Novosphingobium sp. G106]MBV1692351.1 hypothetical protein [Novosphingobium sp. G106]
MGWFFMSTWAMGGFATPKAYLDDQFTYAPDADGGRQYGLRIVKSVWSGSEYYAAAEPWNAEGTLPVFAVVCLVRWNPKAKSGEHFGYKDMSESMGPCYYRCPASVLDLLGPTDSEYAAGWRTRCRQQLALARRRRPRPGDTLVLAEPMQFSDDYEGQSFEVIRYRKGIALRGRNGGYYRISRLMERGWTLIPASPARGLGAGSAAAEVPGSAP